jgi:dihydroneopterin aldolase
MQARRTVGGRHPVRLMDKIVIQEARFQSRVGVSDEERARPQEIIVDIEGFRDLRGAGASDDLSETVCYAAMHEKAAHIIGANAFRLIETIAERLAAMVLRDFPIEKVVVRVRKPAALAARQVLYAAVEITREKNG